MKNRVLYFSKKLISHELITGSFFVFVGAFVSSVLAFLLNVFLARNLVASDYGTYASLLSIFTLAIIPGQAILPVIVKFATSYFSSGQHSLARSLYFSSLKLLSVFALLIILFFTVFSSTLLSFLKISDYGLILLLGIAVAVQYLAVVNAAFLQSLIKFNVIAVGNLLTGFVRLCAGVLLVVLGFNVLGAVTALILSIFSGILFTFYPLRSIFAKDHQQKIKIPYREIAKYAVPTAFSVFFLNSFISTDVILVKHYFNPTDAGLYGGLSLIGKAVFYFTGVIPSVMFPLLIRRHTKGESFHRLFYLALLLVALPSLTISVFYFIFPEFTVSVFLGKKYLFIAPYVGLFAIFITIFNMLNVFVNFFLSLQKTKVLIFVLIAAILQIFLIFLFHSSFYQVIGVSLITSIVFLISLFIFYLIEFNQFKEIKKLIISINNPVE